MSELSKRILVDEILEQSHPVPVEDVILQALENYVKQNEAMWSNAIAFAIIQRIKDAEKEERPIIQNPEKITQLFDFN